MPATKGRAMRCTGDEVRAVLDGRKTQFREVIKPQPMSSHEPWPDDKSCLTWDDVIPTPVSSWAAGGQGVIGGAVDVAVTSALAGIAFEMGSSIQMIGFGTALVSTAVIAAGLSIVSYTRPEE